MLEKQETSERCLNGTSPWHQEGQGQSHAQILQGREQRPFNLFRQGNDIWGEIERMGKSYSRKEKRKETKAGHRMGRHVLTLFTLGELILLLLSFPLPVNCSFTATSCQSEPEGNYQRHTPKQYQRKQALSDHLHIYIPSSVHNGCHSTWLVIPLQYCRLSKVSCRADRLLDTSHLYTDGPPDTGRSQSQEKGHENQIFHFYFSWVCLVAKSLKLLGSMRFRVS